MQITSLVEARRQEDQGLNHLFKYIFMAMVVYVSNGEGMSCFGAFLSMLQLGFLHIWSRVLVLFSGIGTRIQHWNPHIGTPLKLCRYRYSGTSIGTLLEINLVSIHGKEYRYPSSLMELEYRYWLSSTGTGCLITVYGVL
ncbi:hypothetical protein GQ457_15G017570 [Hibiscus cannabinus]